MSAPTLSSIVSRKVMLIERTPGRFVGCCPFHTEQTPSFSVDDETGNYHCFGCGARGDALDFVWRTEPLLFRAILEWLGRLDGEVRS